MAKIPDEVKAGLLSGLEAIAVEYLKKQALAELAKQVPWLFGKYIAWATNPLIGYILDNVISFFLKQTILGLSIAWISVDIQYDVASAEEFAKKFKEVLAHPEKYTEEQKKGVEDGFDEASVELIRLHLRN